MVWVYLDGFVEGVGLDVGCVDDGVGFDFEFFVVYCVLYCGVVFVEGDCVDVGEDMGVVSGCGVSYCGDQLGIVDQLFVVGEYFVFQVVWVECWGELYCCFGGDEVWVGEYGLWCLCFYLQ